MVRKTYARILPVLLFVATLSLTRAAENGGFDHRSHAVPGADKLVYDVDDNGSEEITLDGSGSHSHYFDAGPPIKSGVIEGYEWVNTADNAIVCTSKICTLTFNVGETTLKLRVWDNTGDNAEDEIKVTVLPRSEATSAPRIDKLNPPMGSSLGKNKVTISGDYLYADSEVYFGDTKVDDVLYVNINTIVAQAPEGSGTQDIKVVSSLGESNPMQYEFQAGGSVPIDFRLKNWLNKDGSDFIAEEITSIALGKDHRYYMGSLTGYVTIATVDRDLIVQESCTGAYMGDLRSIGGIAFNPLDPQNRVFVTTNTHFHEKYGARWDNAKVEAVYRGDDNCPIRGETIISGLPVSNHDHGTNHITFNTDGSMLISVGSFSNAGATTPGDGIGGVPENPLSGSVVEADYLRPGFDGEIKYDQTDDPETANIVGGDIRVFTAGLRNCFGMVVHSNGEVYATDNGPNVNFGLTSTSCTSSAPDAESDDKLLRLLRGQYYGHPNRNRARDDPKQCAYKAPWEPTAEGYVEPMGMMTSSTNGIIDYRANTFQGAIRGNLFMSKVSFGENGLLWRAELSENGEWLAAGPYQFLDRSGLSLIMGLWGELVMPQLKKYTVVVYQPFEEPAATVQVLNVFPSRGPRAGGNVIIVTGLYLDRPNLLVNVGTRPCTDFYDVDFNSLKCTVPPGDGKVQVTVTQGEYSSTGYGHDYEYL